MEYEEILKLVREEIKDNLRLESEERETYTFQHDTYTTTTIVKLMLEDECLGEVHL